MQCTIWRQEHYVGEHRKQRHSFRAIEITQSLCLSNVAEKHFVSANTNHRGILHWQIQIIKALCKNALYVGANRNQ